MAHDPKERVASQFVKEQASGETRTWYLAFVDPDRPKARQLLGVAIVRAPGLTSAIAVVNTLQINPGGKIEGAELKNDLDLAPKWLNHLLSEDEIEELDRQMAQAG